MKFSVSSKRQLRLHSISQETSCNTVCLKSDRFFYSGIKADVPTLLPDRWSDPSEYLYNPHGEEGYR